MKTTNKKEDKMKTNYTSEKYINEMYGQGMGLPKKGDKGIDYCICPKCKEKIEHTKGVPCNELKCSKCGIAMMGSDE